MTRLIHSQAKDCHQIINLLPDEVIGKLKDLCIKNHWQFSDIRQQSAKVNLPEETRFKFFKRLMEVKPGFDKGSSGDK